MKMRYSKTFKEVLDRLLKEDPEMAVEFMAELQRLREGGELDD